MNNEANSNEVIYDVATLDGIIAQVANYQQPRLIYDVMPARRALVEEILRLTLQPIVIPSDAYIMLNTGAIVKASSVSIGGDLVNLEGPDSLAKGFI